MKRTLFASVIEVRFGVLKRTAEICHANLISNLFTSLFHFWLRLKQFPKQASLLYFIARVKTVTPLTVLIHSTGLFRHKLRLLYFLPLTIYKIVRAINHCAEMLAQNIKSDAGLEPYLVYVYSLQFVT
ncbi:hypothetical protein Q7W32_06050 [Streptococcus suis]|nr:hypothetical protein [Streptococcus suis]